MTEPTGNSGSEQEPLKIIQSFLRQATRLWLAGDRRGMLAFLIGACLVLSPPGAREVLEIIGLELPKSYYLFWWAALGILLVFARGSARSAFLVPIPLSPLRPSAVRGLRPYTEVDAE